MKKWVSISDYSRHSQVTPSSHGWATNSSQGTSKKPISSIWQLNTSISSPTKCTLQLILSMNSFGRKGLPANNQKQKVLYYDLWSNYNDILFNTLINCFISFFFMFERWLSDFDVKTVIFVKVSKTFRWKEVFESQATKSFNYLSKFLIRPLLTFIGLSFKTEKDLFFFSFSNMSRIL